jgi:O-antigen ligase
VTAWAATARARAGSGSGALWVALATTLAVAVGILAATSPWVLICAGGVVCVALAIMRWPLGAVMALLALRTASRSQFLDLLTVLAGGLALLLAAPRLGGRRVWAPFGLLLVLALVSVPIHPSPDEGVQPGWLFVPKLHAAYLPRMSVELLAWLRLASVFVALLLACWAVNDRKGLRAIVVATLVSAAVPVAIGLQQFATGHFNPHGGEKSIQGPFTHPNYFAFYLVVVLVVGIVAFIETRRVALRALLGALLALCAFCLLETYTRGAWIGFAIAVIGLGAMRYRSLFVAGVLVLAIGSFAFPGTVQKVGQRFGDLSSRSASTASSSWSWRTGEWRRMLHFGFDRPLSGQGFASYTRLTVREFGTETPQYPTIADPQHPGTSSEGFAAHNDYVRMFVEMGVPGLLLWLAVLTGLLTTALRLRRFEALAPWAAASAALAIALIVMSGADNVQGYTVVLVYPATLVGALVGAGAGERARASNSRKAGSAAVAAAR